MKEKVLAYVIIQRRSWLINYTQHQYSNSYTIITDVQLLRDLRFIVWFLSAPI